MKKIALMLLLCVSTTYSYAQDQSISVKSAVNTATKKKRTEFSSISIDVSKKAIIVLDADGGFFKLTNDPKPSSTGCTIYRGESQLQSISIDVCNGKGTFKYLTSNITIDFTY